MSFISLIMLAVVLVMLAKLSAITLRRIQEYLGVIKGATTTAVTKQLVLYSLLLWSRSAWGLITGLVTTPQLLVSHALFQFSR